MGNWDEAVRLQLRALVDALACPKCAAFNRPGAAIIDFEPHLRVACCGCCGASWVVKPAAA